MESLPAAVIFPRNTVATDCPACRMQISAGLRTYFKGIPVYHPVELLAMSLAQREDKDEEKTGTD
ncbi:MAG: hypothetical protein ACYCVD_18065 [Desulfitobacteriaceae bacterium]